eukprot:TRINITY_DN2700_c0_g2_i2.p1 TRINITY_DN2700_c0_g2~~TRINITY_DN2700_c0_g2_i2.p1  ORF type:complete len:326 (+),score=54.30 TRINITY_DN2700_c0_g2_i2:29-1006(+)
MLRNLRPRTPPQAMDLGGHRRINLKVATPEGASPPSGNLKVVSYNIWFDQLAFDSRTNAIIKILRETTADVVCLQEVTPSSWGILVNNPFIRSTFYAADPHAEHLGHYGVAILSRYPIESAGSWPFENTSMGRSLLEIVISVKGEKIRIGCVHLESLNNPGRRRDQLLLCTKILENGFSGKGMILCGDFNFDSKRNFNPAATPLENDILRSIPSWKDTWEACNPNERGLTFDTTTNLMLSGQEHMRYDRILATFLPSRVSLLGNTPIIEDTRSQLYPYHIVYDKELFDVFTNTPKAEFENLRKDNEDLDRWPIFPSDHFGLLAEF